MVALPFFAGPEHAPFVLGDGPRRALLIHGFPGTPAEMRPLARVLVECGWQTHGLLLPGMGSEIARLGEARRAAWLGAARDTWRAILRDDPLALLAGNSMGAAIAVQLAAEAPPGRLLLAAPFWRMSTLGLLLPVAKHFIRTIAPFSRANFGDPDFRAELQRLAPGIDVDDVATQREIRTGLRLPTAVLDEVRLLGARAYRDAGRVRAPVLLLQGTHDRLVRHGDTRRLLARLVGPVVYHEFSAGHELVLLSGPAAEGAAQAVRAFVTPEAADRALAPRRWPR